MSAREIGVAVLGLGFMGRTHVAAYRAASRAGFANRLVAVCDPDPARRRGEAPAGGNLETGAQDERLFDPDEVRGTADPAEVFADAEVDLVSICTYTDTHTDLALQALAAGKHVLVEKPVALTSADARRLADAAASAGTLCMPAQCIRFWPGWDWLKHQVASGELGRVRSATFQRLGSRPGWGQGFYDDPERTGGALLDLHVHDADFIRWCFGQPARVVSTGDLNHLTTLYHFEGGEAPVHVVAEGAWDLAPTAGFRMRYTVTFEQATADYDLGREHPLTLHRAEESETVELPASDGYEGEVRHLLAAIAEGDHALLATCEEAVGVLELLEAERRSLETGMPVAL